MADLGLTPPLTIRRASDESYVIRDAAGRSVASVYFAEDPERRSVMRRVGPEQALRIAQTIARAIRSEIEGKG